MSTGRDDTADGRDGRSEWQEWFLLDGHRMVVAGATVLVVFVALAALSVSGIVAFRNTTPLERVLAGFIPGDLTVITVTVAISQLLLSRELNSPGELHSRMEGVEDFREEVEDAAGRVAPVEPLGFLQLLFESTRQKAQRLGGLATSEADESVQAELDEVVDDVTARADAMDDLLDADDTSTFHVLSVTLTTNYAQEVHRLRQIRVQHGDDLPEDVAEGIDALVAQIQHIDVARQYFKAIYFEEELADLSRYLFYAGIPALVVVAAALLLLTSLPDASVARPQFSVLVSALVATGFVPIAVLFAYILRISTVTKRTTATLPFTTPARG